MAATIDSTRLRDRTLYLVQNRPARVQLKDIAAATGLPAAWLSAFARGEIAEPSVNRIECLWEYLAGRKIGLD